MPNLAAFIEILEVEANSLSGFPVNTRADIIKVATEERRRTIRKRNELTGNISKAWKEGFAALKAENDQMQKDLAQAYKDVDQMIAERVADQLAGIQK